MENYESTSGKSILYATACKTACHAFYKCTLVSKNTVRFFVFIVFPSEKSVSLVYFIVKNANKVYMMLVFLPYFGADAVLLAYLEWAFYQNSRKPSYIMSWFVPFESLSGQKPPGPRGWPTLQERAEVRLEEPHTSLKKIMFGSWIQFLLHYFQCTGLLS